MSLVERRCVAWQTASVVLAIAVQLGDATGAAAFVAAVFPVWSFRRDDAFARRVGALRGAVHLGSPPSRHSTPRPGGGQAEIGVAQPHRYNSCTTQSPSDNLGKFPPKLGLHSVTVDKSFGKTDQSLLPGRVMSIPPGTSTNQSSVVSVQPLAGTPARGFAREPGLLGPVDDAAREGTLPAVLARPTIREARPPIRTRANMSRPTVSVPNQ